MDIGKRLAVSTHSLLHSFHILLCFSSQRLVFPDMFSLHVYLFPPTKGQGFFCLLFTSVPVSGYVPQA